MNSTSQHDIARVVKPTHMQGVGIMKIKENAIQANTILQGWQSRITCKVWANKKLKKKIQTKLTPSQ